MERTPEADRPPQQYLGPAYVISAMSDHARRSLIGRGSLRNAALAVAGGMLITAGALFSVILSVGVETAGPAALLQGVGFSAGFFFVILLNAVLFTEVNVIVPAHVLDMGVARHCGSLARFWAIAALGNLAGALVLGWSVHLAQSYPQEQVAVLQDLVAKKMAYAEEGTAAAWFRIVLSGMLANWLVGMAAFYATMGRTIIGKYVPILLAVSLFVTANFQHSPANAGYFALIMPGGTGPGWMPALLWNLIPAAIGNVLGGVLLVALPLWYVFRPRKSASAVS